MGYKAAGSSRLHVFEQTEIKCMIVRPVLTCRYMRLHNGATSPAPMASCRSLTKQAECWCPWELRYVRAA